MSSFDGLLNKWVNQTGDSGYDQVKLGVTKSEINKSDSDKPKSNITREASGLSQNQWQAQQKNETKLNETKLNETKLNATELDPDNLTLEQKNHIAMNNPTFEFDRYFLSWLRSNNVSFLISSYKTHKVFSIGIINDPKDGNDKLSLWMNQFNRPMGIHTTSKTIWLSTSGNLWRFENTGKFTDNTTNLGEFDANYVPRMAYFSNDIDAHDVCVDADNNPYYCSALFGCICTPSVDHSFKVYWKPPWLSKVAPEDRCHLNGLCSRNGVPRYVTAVCKSDVRGAWREKRIGHGIVYDIVEEKEVCHGLTMPHSPRWANGKLWILDAGTGYFGYTDFETNTFVQKVFIPGYLRGLSFVGDRFAVIGSSQDRNEATFQGLPLGEKLKKEGISSKCGLYVVNLETFDIIHNLTFYSPIDELYDICAIPGIRRPRLTDIGDEHNMREYKVDYNGFD